jgi:hypothetical protein
MWMRSWPISPDGVAMAYKRRLLAEEPLSAEALASAMAGLGMAVAAPPDVHANPEDTVLAAGRSGMEDDDYRVLGLLVGWLERHHARLNADRLIRAVLDRSPPRLAAFWRSRARAWKPDRRWRRLADLPGDDMPLLRVGNAFQIARHGEDPRFVGTGLLVPRGVLRERPGDVADPEAVARQHPAYRYRVMIGPGYRADCWALLEEDPERSPTELARRTYAPFATAWQVRQDFRMLRDRFAH